MTPKEILKKPYGRIFIPEENGGYSTMIGEFPGCFSQGDTLSEAADSLEAAAEAWLEAAMESGYPIPEPQIDSSFFVMRASVWHNGKALFGLPVDDGITVADVISLASLRVRYGAALELVYGGKVLQPTALPLSSFSIPFGARIDAVAT